MYEKLINQISKDTGVHPADIAEVIAWMRDTQILCYTYDDPDGCNFVYADLDELALDAGMFAAEMEGSWPVRMQIEFREPVMTIQVSGGTVRVSE